MAHPSRLVSSERFILNDGFPPLALFPSLDARLGRCTAMAEPIRLVAGFDDMAVMGQSVQQCRYLEQWELCYIGQWGAPELVKAIAYTGRDEALALRAVTMAQSVGELPEVFSTATGIRWAMARGYLITGNICAWCGVAPGNFGHPHNPLAPANAPAGKVKAVTDTSPSGDDMEEQAPAADDHDHDETLAKLFNPVPVEALAKMFMTDVAQWKKWTEKAAANGLIDARTSHGMFNPYKAGVWFISKGYEGWSHARLYRTLKNNLPARSLDEAHLFGGDLD